MLRLLLRCEAGPWCSARRCSELTPLQKRIRDRMSRPPLPTSVVIEGPNETERALPEAVMKVHQQSVDMGEHTYKDPITGLVVFTRAAHIQKGRCCGCKCRHCPYGHVNVPASRRSTVNATAVPTAAPTTVENAVAEPAAPAGSSVYTRTGDKGASSLFTGERRSKTDLVFHTLGTIDELNSHVGLARAFLSDAQHEASLSTSLSTIQHRLLHCGAVFATPGPSSCIAHDPREWTLDLEQQIDALDKVLPQLTGFILPGGGTAAAQLHVCRSTCRRAERCVVELLQQETYEPVAQDAAIFVNRLSDFFFVAARSVTEDGAERSWNKSVS